MNVQCVCKNCKSVDVSCLAIMDWAPRYQKFLVVDFVEDSWFCEKCDKKVDVEQVEYTGEVDRE